MKCVGPPRRCFWVGEVDVGRITIPPSCVDGVLRAVHEITFSFTDIVPIAVQIYERMCPQGNFETIQFYEHITIILLNHQSTKTVINNTFSDKHMNMYHIRIIIRFLFMIQLLIHIELRMYLCFNI